MDKICKTCGKPKVGHWVKGGKKLGVYNGDIKTGCYIDVHNRFITPEGVAIDEEGKVLLDDKGNPILGDTPSYIDVENWTPDGKPRCSLYEIERRKRMARRFLNINHTDDGLLLIDYLRIFNIRPEVDDETLTTHNAVSKVWKRYRHFAKTVMEFSGTVFRRDE
jgi:hypothetical protein